MSFWCLQFPPKNERKQVNLRFHSSKVEFVRSFFGGNVYLKISFRLFLTFRRPSTMAVNRRFMNFFSLNSIKKSVLTNFLTKAITFHDKTLWRGFACSSKKFGSNINPPSLSQKKKRKNFCFDYLP